MNDDWFFLSYAKFDLNNDSSNAVRQLYFNLDQKIRLKKRQGGFFDETSIQQGDRWPDALAQALISCRVLLCCYSSAYFASDYCGREWKVFASRLGAAPSKNSPILPILLDPPSDLRPLPKAVEDVQYGDNAYPEIYRENGLRYLLNRRSDELKNAYQDFLDVLANRIIQRAEQNPASKLSTIPDIKSVKSAFTFDANETSATQVEPTTAVPRYADFVYVAATKKEIELVGRSAINYGEEGEVDWKPFLPGFNLDKEVALMAQEVATREGFRYHRFEAAGPLIELLEKAQQNKQIVVLIVDTWTLKLSKYSKLMQEYDRINLWNCGTLVTWNFGDRETLNHQQGLKKNVRAVFINKTSFRQPYFVDDIREPKAFAKKLSILLQKLRSQIIKSSQVLADNRSDAGDPIPGVQVPGASL